MPSERTGETNRYHNERTGETNRYPSERTGLANRDPSCSERKRHAAIAKRLAVASAAVVSASICVLAAVWLASRWVNNDEDRLYRKTAFAVGTLTVVLGVAFWALEVASAVYDQKAQKEETDNEETADDEIASGVSIAATVFVTFAAFAVVGSGMATALPFDGTRLTTHRSRIEYYGFALFMMVAFALPLTVAASATIQAKNC